MKHMKKIKQTDICENKLINKNIMYECQYEYLIKLYILVINLIFFNII